MIKICLLKNKIILSENNTDSQIHPIRHNVTTDHNTATQNLKKMASQKMYKTLDHILTGQPALGLIRRKLGDT